LTNTLGRWMVFPESMLRELQSSRSEPQENLEGESEWLGFGF
jgi:hypothetical protein